MIIKIIVKGECIHIFDSETCSDREKKLIKTYMEHRKINKSIKVVEGTEEEYNKSIKEWEDIISLFND